MKMKTDKKYLFWGLTALFVVCGSILFYYSLFHLDNIINVANKFMAIIMPIVDGLVLAYLMSPITNFFEKKLMGDVFRNKTYNEKTKKRIRLLIVLFSYLLVGFIIYEFFKLVIPELKVSIQSIIDQFDVYAENFEKWLDKILVNFPQLESVVSGWWSGNGSDLTTWISENVLTKANDFLATITSGVFSVLTALWNLIIGIIISIYLLCGKETFLGQAKKMVYALMKRSTANAFIHNVRFTNKTFIGFLGGKIIDSIIIGILCLILTSIMDTPYKTLISVIIGVTNVIPFFGPYIGAIPSAILVLMVDPMECLHFVIMIFLLQQFDGNILGPKILGDSTGLSSFWVIFSITIFGGLFGVLGMIVGVPLFAVIYTGIKAYVKAKLEDKDLTNETSKYVYVDYIDEKHNYIKIPREQISGLFNIIAEKKKNAEADQETNINNNVKNSDSDDSYNNNDRQG